MAKTKLEKDLERDLKKESQGSLCRMCAGKRLSHTGDKEALVARLVAFEIAKAAEPEVETPPAEPEAPAEDPGSETPPEDSGTETPPSED